MKFFYFLAFIFVSFDLCAIEIYLIPYARCDFKVLRQEDYDRLKIYRILGDTKLNIPVFEVIVNGVAICNAFKIGDQSWVTAAHCDIGDRFSLRDPTTAFENLKYFPHILYDGFNSDVALVKSDDNEFFSLVSETQYIMIERLAFTKRAIIVTHSRVEKVSFYDDCQEFLDKIPHIDLPVKDIKDACVVSYEGDGPEIIKPGDSGAPVFKVVKKNGEFEYYFSGILHHTLGSRVGVVYPYRQLYLEFFLPSVYPVDYLTLISIALMAKIMSARTLNYKFRQYTIQGVSLE